MRSTIDGHCFNSISIVFSVHSVQQWLESHNYGRQNVWSKPTAQREPMGERTK